VTVLFSDLRGFTAQSEQGDPSQVFDELNEYFSHMVGEILGSGGWVDKFMGDGILAVWGTLERRPPAEEAAAACACARAMRKSLAALNVSRTARGLAEWRLGIGIHSGPVLFGNLGTEAKMEPTVIGDTVNLASRIEGYTKALSTDILFSAATRAGIAPGAARSADRVRLLGRKQAVELFAFWPEDFKEPHRLMHEEALAAFRAGRFDAASRGFRRLLDDFPEDSLTANYFARCEALIAKPPASGWDGTVDATGK
jgi:adenylate cyclase